MLTYYIISQTEVFVKWFSMKNDENQGFWRIVIVTVITGYRIVAFDNRKNEWKVLLFFQITCIMLIIKSIGIDKRQDYA